MGVPDQTTHRSGPDRIQAFIFARELAEVYLLLDYLSGRSDKGLVAAFGDGDEQAGTEKIQQICQIAWPPTGTPVEQAKQAATLMMAKDRLNTAAKPANGASIAFTLLVAGEEEAAGRAGAEFRSLRRWLRPPPRTGRREGVTA